MLLKFLFDSNESRIGRLLSISLVVSSILPYLADRGGTSIDLHELLLEVETIAGGLIIGPELNHVQFRDTSILAKI